MAEDSKPDPLRMGWQAYATTALPLLVALLFYVKKLAWERLAEHRPDGIEVLVPVEDAEIDIVAVHGLGAHPVYTWTARTEPPSSSETQPPNQHRVNWLKDDGFLRSDFEKARIMAFCYNADWLLQAPAVTTEQRASTLLRELKRQRDDKKSSRPILFIGHSYGGVIIKLALCEAAEDEYKDILQSTRGVIFLGTPHQGSSAASWAAVMVSALGYVPYLGSKATLFKLLCSHSDQLATWRNRFSKTISRHTPKPLLYSVIETMETYVFGLISLGLVVGRDSGTIESGIDPIAIDVTHTGLNKCRNNKDRLYREVSDMIRKVVSFSESCTSMKQKADTDSERAECLRALASGAQNPRQEDESIDRAVHDTGAEVFEQPAYQAWTASENSDVLWLVGKAGAGKSTFLLEALRRFQKRTGQPPLERMLDFDDGYNDLKRSAQGHTNALPKAIVASYFYNFRDKSGNEVNVASMLQSLLFQILFQENMLFPIFRDTYFKYKTKSLGPSSWAFNDLRAIFSRIINSQDFGLHIDLFVDALDESEQSRLVLELMSETVASIGEKRVVVKALVACRDIDVLLEVPPEKQIHLENHNSREILTVIEQGVLKIEERLPKFYDKVQMAQNMDKVKEFKTEMYDRAQGTILWVSLALATVASDLNHGTFTIARMMKALDDLPSDLEDLYAHIIMKLKAKGEKTIADIRYWLQWAAYAGRSLTVAEFFHAIALPDMQQDPDDFQNKIIPHFKVEGVRTTLSNCGGFLKVQRTSSELVHLVPHDFEVQIAHRSVFTFLCKSTAAPFQVIREKCHLKIVDASIDYLMIVLISRTVSLWDQNNYASFAKHLNDHPLLCYILSELITHLEFMPRDYLPSRLDRISTIQSRVSSEDACALLLQTWILEILGQHCSAPVHSDMQILLKHWQLQMQASFNWELLRQPTLKQLLEIFWGQSIVAAIEKDYLAAFKVMCHAGVLSCCTQILPSCVEAAANLDRFAILDYLGRIPHPPASGIPQALEKVLDDALLLACRAGKDAIVRWLLEVGPLWGWKKSNQINNGLSIATSAGHFAVIRVLLNHGTSPNHSDQDGSTPLHVAARNGYTNIVELLLEKGANPNSQDVALRTPLDEANESGHEAVLKTLWQHSKTALVLSKRERILLLPFRQNPNFIGRTDILVVLTERVMTSKFLALVGIGGVGKTSIAAELAYRNAPAFTIVLWINANTMTHFFQSHQYAYERLYGNTGNGKIDTEAQIEQLYRRLELEEGQKLVVWDNLDDSDMLMTLAVNIESVHVLITTRAQDVARKMCRDSDILNVFEFSEEESVRAFSDVPDFQTNVADLRMIARRLDNLPLAIFHAAAFMRQRRCSPQEYISMYEKRERTLRTETRLPDAERSSVNLRFETSLALLDEFSVKMLSFLSVLDPDYIPRYLLLNQNLWPQLPPDEVEVQESINQIHNMSLIRLDSDGTGAISIHRFTQSFLQARQSTKDLQGNQEMALRVVSAALPIRDDTTRRNDDQWRKCEELLPHALKVLDYEVVNEEKLFEQTQKLLRNAGAYLADRCDYVLAQKLLERAYVASLKHKDDLHDTDIMKDMDNLALIHKVQGLYKDASDLYENALTGTGWTLRKPLPESLMIWNHYASVLEAQGEYERALEIYTEGSHVGELALGPDHPDTLCSRSGMAGALQERGQYEYAEKIHLGVLESVEASPRTHDMSSLASMNGLAKLNQVRGDFRRAEEFYQRALKLGQKNLASQHPFMLTSMNGLALLSYDQHQYEEAEHLARQVLEARRKVLKPDHPDTLTSMSCLANIIAMKPGIDEQEYGEALTLSERAYEEIVKILHWKHPLTVKCRQTFEDIKEKSSSRATG